MNHSMVNWEGSCSHLKKKVFTLSNHNCLHLKFSTPTLKLEIWTSTYVPQG